MSVAPEKFTRPVTLAFAITVSDVLVTIKKKR